jgi:hypothetical protein
VPLLYNNQTIYLRAIKINQTGGYAITSSAVSNSTIGQVDPVTSSVDAKININGSSTTILGPLIIEDDISNMNGLLYLGSKNTYVTTDLSNSTLFNNQINLTIGLITGLIAVAVIVSIAIMKKIMNSLDEDLI